MSDRIHRPNTRPQVRVRHVRPKGFLQKRGHPYKCIPTQLCFEGLGRRAVEGRFFRGYCRSCCYLPLYNTCGNFVLCARLRRANIDAPEVSVSVPDENSPIAPK